MDFGKLSNINGRQFFLPPHDIRTFQTLGKNGRTLLPKVYVGAPVWTSPTWIGKVYPKGTAQRDYLRFYAQQFNAIELNTSFYRIPSQAQIRAWRAMVPDGFKFVVKFHQDISHCGNLLSTQEILKHFLNEIEAFEESLGICFLQLPPNLSFGQSGELAHLLLQIPNRKQVAVELRHPSWFSNGHLRPEAFHFFHQEKITTVITDTVGRRDVLHSSLTSKTALVRFLGNELHPSDYDRIDAWVDRASDWINSGLEELYFFVHQPTEAEVPELTQYLIERLNLKADLNLQHWTPAHKLESTHNPQLSLF